MCTGDVRLASRPAAWGPDGVVINTIRHELPSALCVKFLTAFSGRSSVPWFNLSGGRDLAVPGCWKAGHVRPEWRSCPLPWRVAGIRPHGLEGGRRPGQARRGPGSVSVMRFQSVANRTQGPLRGGASPSTAGRSLPRESVHEAVLPVGDEALRPAFLPGPAIFSGLLAAAQRAANPAGFPWTLRCGSAAFQRLRPAATLGPPRV